MEKKSGLCGLFVAVFAIGFGFAYVDSNLISMKTALNLSLGQTVLVINVFIFFMATLLMPLGHLSDRLGNKLFFTFGIVGLGVFPLLFALSTNYTWALVFRAMEGVSAACILPTSIAHLTTHFKDFTKSMAYFLFFFVLGLLIGPLLATLAQGYVTWNFGIFFMPVLCLVAFVLTRSLKETKIPGHIDYLGMILSFFATAIACFTILRSLNLETKQIIILSIVALFLFVILLVHEHKHKFCLDPKVLLHPTFIVCSLASLILVLLAWIGYFASALYLQNMLLKSPQKLEFFLLCVPLPFILVTIWSSYMDHIKAIGLGGLLLGAGYIIQSFFDLETGNLQIVVSMVLIGGGIGFMLPNLSGLALHSIWNKTKATESSIVLFIQSLSVVIGLTLTGAILRFQGQLQYFRDLAGQKTSKSVGHVIASFFKTPQKFFSNLEDLTKVFESRVISFLQNEFLEKYQLIMWILVGVVVLIVLMGIFGAKKKKKRK